MGQVGVRWGLLWGWGVEGLAYMGVKKVDVRVGKGRGGREGDNKLNEVKLANIYPLPPYPCTKIDLKLQSTMFFSPKLYQNRLNTPI